jgi:hypothetical protein
MSDEKDVLAHALAALRETTAGKRPDASATRARILLGARASRRTRTRFAYAAIALAAAFVASTAWAGATGHLPRILVLIEGWFHATEPAMAPGVDARTTPPASPDLTATPPLLTPTPSSTPDPTPTPTPTATPVRAPALPPAPSAPRPRASVAAAPVDTSDAEDTLYRNAHRAHFVDKDPARALQAWDAYLAAYPSGRYVLEARYNRALDLVRLGRKGDARAALEPFARGDMSGYRQAEARQILDALEK